MTTNSAPAWRPDLFEFSPTDAVPDALILQLSTVAGTVDGDEPSVHVGYIDDATAVFKAEGATLDESQPGLNEVVVHTAKLTQLVRLSREQYYHPPARRSHQCPACSTPPASLTAAK
jgi:hypothetical protein